MTPDSITYGVSKGGMWRPPAWYRLVYEVTFDLWDTKSGILICRLEPKSEVQHLPSQSTGIIGMVQTSSSGQLAGI